MKTSPIVVIRNLIEKYKDSDQCISSQLWVCLSEFFIRVGDFGIARDIFEQSLDIEQETSIKTVKDFALLFNAYLRFEHQMLDLENLIPTECSQDLEQADFNPEEFQLFRIKNLIERRPFLLSDVKLINSPNDVSEWLTRIKLCDSLEDPNIKAQVYHRAISNIDP